MRKIIVATALALLAVPAWAQAPQCKTGLDEVQRMMAETPMPPEKTIQVRALLDQVVRACKENNDVVASAGIDQVKAIIQEQKKGGA
jgi:hypothetical protein